MKQNSSYSPDDLLDHILNEIEILLEIKKRASRKQFYRDEFLKRVAIRSYEVIGEVSKKLSEDFKKSNPQIEWKKMAGMRDIMIHDYLNVDYEILWSTITENIPSLKKEIKKLKKKLKNG